MMMALGCIQSRACNTNHCPTGIATQDPARTKALDVQAKHKRVANYQHATVHSCMELVGAMGMDDPDKLNPSHILRRVDDETTLDYDQIYSPLKPDELLGDKVNEEYAAYWGRASADAF